MTYFNPTPIQPTFNVLGQHREAVTGAYRAAGLTPPSIVDELASAIAAESTPEEVAQRWAAESLKATGDPREMLDQALADFARAQSVVEFARQYQFAVELAFQAHLDEYIDDAVTALRPSFHKLATTFAKAARALDNIKPFDKDIAFERNTVSDYKTVTAGLATLAAFCIAQRSTENVAPTFARALCVITVPSVTTQEATQAPISASSQIRRLSRDIRDDADLAVLRVARGNYGPDVNLDIASTTELARRLEAAHNALLPNRELAAIGVHAG